MDNPWVNHETENLWGKLCILGTSLRLNLSISHHGKHQKHWLRMSDYADHIETNLLSRKSILIASPQGSADDL